MLETIPIAPGIMLNRIVVEGSNPKSRMTIGPKALIPPETRLIQKTKLVRFDSSATLVLGCLILKRTHSCLQRSTASDRGKPP